MKIYPYSKYVGTVVWSVLDRAIVDLVKNQDIEEKTAHEYIVGYLLQELDKNSLLK